MTQTPQQQTVVDHLMRWAGSRPDAPWLTQPYPDGRVEDLSWKQAADQVARMAAHLLDLRLPAGSSIVLLGRNSAHWMLADLAILMAGHVSVPLYPTLGADTARYILEHCEARLIVIGKLDGKADNWFEIEKILPADLPRIGLPMSPRGAATAQWTDIVAATAPLPAPVAVQFDDLATIVYTSGSTGHPKGVMHSFRTLAAPSRSTDQLWQVSTDERMLSYLPLAHIAERVAVEVASLVHGFHVYFADRLETFQQDLQRARPTIFFSVPRLWTKFYLGVCDKLPLEKQRRLFRIPLLGRYVKRKILKQLGLDHVRVALTGSAPLPPHIIEWYRSLGLELFDVFGMTENCATSHSCRPGEVRPGYVGSPVPGVECRIAEDGEILVKSPGQMLGYYKQPELTQASMTPDGFFKTGDRGEIDERGRLRITGRVKELFKTSKGKYVAPVPLENRLNAHPKLESVCVTGPGSPQPFALLMLSADAQQELADGRVQREALQAEFESLLKVVNDQSEDHEKLDFAVVVGEQWTMDNGFLTPTMKIRRHVIEQQYLSRAEQWRGSGRRVIWA